MEDFFQAIKALEIAALFEQVRSSHNLDQIGLQLLVNAILRSKVSLHHLMDECWASDGYLTVEAELVKQILLCAGLIEGDASDTVAPDAPDFVQVCEIIEFVDLQMFNTYQNTPATEHKEALQTLLHKTNERMAADHRSEDEVLYEHLQEWVPTKILFVH